jgi:hypothetical protein
MIRQPVCLPGKWQDRTASNPEAGLVCFIVPAVVDTSRLVPRNSWLIDLRGFIITTAGRKLM